MSEIELDDESSPKGESESNKISPMPQIDRKFVQPFLIDMFTVFIPASALADKI